MRRLQQHNRRIHVATYRGYSTQNVYQPRTTETTGAFGGAGTTTVQPRIVKKFSLTDAKLVAQDLVNAFSIKQGEKVGQPTYGTTLWNYLFEPNTPSLTADMETEIRRVVAGDPRIILSDVAVWPQDNGVLFELQMTFNPWDEPMVLTLNMNKNDGSVKLMPGV